MHRVYNYGSVLQTYATQRVLEDAGLQCEILDYLSPYRAKKPLFLEYPPKLEGKQFKKILYYVAKIPSFVLKDVTFGGFIKKYLKLSPRQYITNDDILNHPPIADIYITGSDQVWNSKYNHGVDPSYYLNYAPTGAKKIAFVSSFGRSKLSKEEIDIVKPLLKEYHSISVREDSAAGILAGMGINSEVLIDPTLQVRKEEWLSLASPLLVNHKYLLLFLLYNEDNGATEYAIRVAKKKGLKVVKLSWNLKKPHNIDYLFTHRRPNDFLSLFANTEFVVTNSFHGVAFSINMNRQFVFVPRTEFNGRIDSLLRLTGLYNRKIVELDNIDISEQMIDFNEVNTILEHERIRAMRYLKGIVNSD